MKKLLILMLVLGLATAAQAGLAELSLSINGAPAPAEYTLCVGDIITIGVVSANTEPWTGYLELADIDDVGMGYRSTRANWLEETMVETGIGEMGFSTPDAYDYLDNWELNVGGITSPPVAGTQFAVDLQCTALGDVAVILYPSDWMTEIQRITIHQVPEPATMLLLGLGGLLLRRRK